jgi:UDP-N-acetylmuramoyl-L-alanyl-D-glutamate--2,6-diaminopimelate ligase
MRTRDLLEALPQAEVVGPLPEAVRGVVGDSRRVVPGDLFVAIRGLVDDGHRYVAEARARGAVLVVGEDRDALAGGPYVRVAHSRPALGLLAAAAAGHPSRRLRTVGVTGTNGKTTTSHLVAAVFEQAGLPCGVIGTVGVRLGGQLEPARYTTPAADELQGLLARMVDLGMKAVSMEVSSQALDQDRHVGTEFDGAVFTNLTQDHLDYHGTLERYLAAKLRLFEALAEGTKGGRRWAAVRIADPVAPRFREVALRAGARVVEYGLDRGEVRAEGVELTAAGSRLTLVTPEGRIPVRLSLPGRFNVENALAAAAAAVGEGLSLEATAAGLERVQGVAGRFEAVEGGQPYSVVVDYAHTPDGLVNVLQAAREVCRGRVILVFGAGGDRDRGKRPLMGEAAGRLADYSILTSDNPRSEDPERILDDLEEGFRRVGGRGERQVDRRLAIRRALSLARPGDLVLIAGKGHERTQNIGGRLLPFDDREVAAEELAALAPW